MVFEFLKKFFRKEEDKNTVSFEEIADFLDSHEKEFLAKKEEFDFKVKDRLERFVVEIDEKKSILESLNLDEKKADSRAIFIVKQNLNYYLNSLDNLIENIRGIGNYDLIQNINEIFLNFKERSKAYFNKSTFLIGKELEGVEMVIESFFKDLNKIVKDSSDVQESLKAFSEIRKTLENISEVDSKGKDIDSEIEMLRIELGDVEKSKSGIMEGIMEIKNSENYKKENEIKENYDMKVRELDKMILDLKSDVDFKYLGNLYHFSEKNMDKIKKFQNSFKEEFGKDRGKSLRDLIGKGHPNKEGVLKKIENVLKKIDEVEKIDVEFPVEEKIKDMNEKLKDLIFKKESVESEIKKSVKRKGDVVSEKRDLVENVREGLYKIGIELKD